MSEELQIKDSFVDLERYRLQLEENVAKLQKSLHHWQTWELEYEGFKEELLGLGDDHTNAELRYAGATFGGTVLNGKEISLLLKDSQGLERSSQQVVSLLNNRINYVQENVKSLGKLLEDADKNLATSHILSQPEIRNDEGLPLREIREELDEEGNVISSSITNPDNAAPHLLEALRRAGVNHLPDTKVLDEELVDAPAKEMKAEQSNRNGKEKLEKTTSEVSKVTNSNGTAGDQELDLQPNGKPPTRRKKGVTFAEGTKKEDATAKIGNNFVRPRTVNGLRYGVLNPWQNPLHPYSSTPSDSSSDAQSAGKENKSTSADSLNYTKGAVAFRSPPTAPDIELENNEKVSNAEPFSTITPMGDSPEDALLRQQMIKYNMEDIGAVVAEIDLEDEGSESWSDEEGDDKFDSISEQEEDEEDEDEDDFGRTNRCVVDDKYRMEMLALEKKLNAKAIQNIGRETSLPESIKREIGLEMMDEKKQETFPDQAPFPAKHDYFADGLEVQSSQSLGASQGLSDGQSRSPKAEIFSNESSKSFPNTKKISRFKSSRKGLSEEDTRSINTPTPATFTKRPISSTIIERSTPKPVSPPPPTPSSSTILERPHSTSAAQPDELDPALLQQQVVTEYHHMRNRMIQRQGGFLASAEEEALGGRIKLEEGEGGTKVSRFKAARLRTG